eukprot:evm.model.scf_3379.1 EVM.evm.TU.scf_3379.1   scf_3379:128-1781(-)
MDPDPPVRCWSGANVFNDPRICDRVVEVTVAPGEAPRGRSPGAVDPPGSTSAHVIDLTADGCPRPGSPDGAAQPGAMDWDRRPGADGWAPGTAGAGQDGGREAKSAMYYVHSAHLALASDYFRCLLERWGDPADPGGPIRLTLAPEEAAVVAPLLEFAHGGRLPAHLKPPELLSLLKLADKYGVGALVERSAAALLEMERGLGLEVLIDCLDLADRANISDNVLVRRLLDLCDEALIDAFGDLEEVWACEDSRQRFLELPIQAVRCLLASSRLRVATENTVFVAVTAWLRGRFPGGMAGLRPEEGEEYRRCARELAPWVRFPQLSNTFLAHVAACVEWFQSLECHQYLWEEAMKFKVACPEKQAHVATRVTRDNRYLPRQPSVITGGLSFEWHVSVEDLRGTLDKPPWKKNFLESERHYFGGEWVGLPGTSGASPANCGPSRTLWLSESQGWRLFSKKSMCETTVLWTLRDLRSTTAGFCVSTLPLMLFVEEYFGARFCSFILCVCGVPSKM